jgi:pyridinium-3,5-bisthiocarboxylic acid mononucleotide nickel chelatase
VTIAYFDCFSGISGDMTLGALLDAGGDRQLLDDTINVLGLSHEVQLDVRREGRGHLTGVRVDVQARAGRSRNLPELERAVREAELPARVRDLSLDAIGRLAAAESRIHDLPPEQVHLHELGGADTLVDVVGAFWLLDSLDVVSAFASPLPAPRGINGELPLPAPAAMRVLEGSGAVFEPDPQGRELVTPTGAAILAACARFERPAMTLDRIGYGVGARATGANALAVWLGHPVAEAGNVTVLETNLDDMPPNQVAALVEDLLAAGALDVTVTPALMKKGRSGHLVSVMTERSRSAELTQLLLTQSSTLGVRMTQAARVIAARRILEIETELGAARVKVKEIDGTAVDLAPEYEDCRRLARESGLDLRRVTRLVERTARDQLGIP